MFVYFFLTYYDNDISTRGYATAVNDHANTHYHQMRRNMPQAVTFNSVLTRFCKMLSFTSGANGANVSGSNEMTRRVLINIDDAAVFQLETMYPLERCFCTYNLETKRIGFGNTIHTAVKASGSAYTQSPTAANGSGSFSSAQYGMTSSTMLNFYPEHVKNRDSSNDWSYQCTDNFYPQILEELNPYIVYEKQYSFMQTFSSIESDSNFVDKFIETFSNEKEEWPKFNGYNIPFVQSFIAFQHFMNDDPDIMSVEHFARFRHLAGHICFEMMKISNETF